MSDGVESFPEPWEDEQAEPVHVDEARTRVVQPRGSYISTGDVPDRFWDWFGDVPKAYNLDQHTVVDEGTTGFGLAEPQPTPLEPPTPSTHRSGTCFEQESVKMREACVDALHEVLETDEVLHEVRHQKSGYHTDLVYADLDHDAVQERALLTNSTAPLHDPLQRFRVWWFLVEYGPKPKGEAIENGRYADPSKNRRHLEWLLSNGYVAETTAGYVDGVRPPKIADLHAVELKRRDWETALEQAARANRCDVDSHIYAEMPAAFFDRFGYADYRWVALDAGAIDAALSHADRFREQGVGLLAIAEGGTVVKHIDAEYAPRRRYTRDRAHAESQVWEALDLDAASPETDESDTDNSTQPSLGAFKADTDD